MVGPVVITFEDYQAGDIDRIEARDVDDFHVPTVKAQLESSYTFTVKVDDAPVAILAIHHDMPGVGTAWAIISDAARGKHAVRLTKGARVICQSLMRDLQLHRLHTYVQPVEEYRRWIRVLGFSYESTAHQALPNRGDLETWVTLREDG